MSIEKFNDQESFNRGAARLFISVIRKKLSEEDEAFIALSGGSTPFPIYHLLKDEYSENMGWENVNFFWVDERTVPPTHQDSNFGNACDALLNYLPSVKTHRIKGEYSPEVAAEEYEKQLKKEVPSENGLPCFDLLWLGMGSDGHTASIFPNSEVINEKDDWVKSVWVDKLDTHRLTLTFPVINNARNRMIVIKGAQKLKIFNEIQKIGKKKYPIQHIQTSNAKDYWIVGKN